jgi:hypothetical protein
MRTLVLTLLALVLAAPAAAQSRLRGTTELNVDIADCTQTKTYDLVVSGGGTPRLDIHGHVTDGRLRFTLTRPDG